LKSYSRGKIFGKSPIAPLKRGLQNFYNPSSFRSLAKDILNFQRNDQNLGLVVTFWGKRPPKGISSQNTLLNNFSPVQPIFTWDTPMDSAQLAETRGFINIFSNPILGEQSGNFQKSSPSINFEPFDRFSHVIY
jgi:hypothetical protein